MKKRKLKPIDWLIILLIIAVFTAVIIMTSVQTLRTMNSRIEDTAMLRMDTIRAELQESLTADQNALKRFADSVEQLQERNATEEELRSYVRRFKDEQAVRTNGVNFNCYVASRSFVYIPDFNMPEDYHATERSWYVGAVDAHGEIYLTEPYIDQMTGEICFTMSVMLKDQDMVVSMDFTLSEIQQSIDKMVGSEENYSALIVTKDQMVVGYSDMSYVGKYVSQDLPDYKDIVKTVIDEQTETFSGYVGETAVTVFSGKANVGWYLILLANRSTLYSSTYHEIAIRGYILVGILLLILFLYVLSARNRVKAEQALKARDAFLTNVSQELKEPLSRIVQLSDVKHLENSVNVKESMESIKASGLQLEGMLDNLFSYSAMVQEEDAAKETRSRKRDISKTIRVSRVIIVIIFLVTMVLSTFLNLRQASENAKFSMVIETQTYGQQVRLWLQTQETILEVFANSLQINPHMPDDYEACVAWLQGLAAPHPEISACYIANPYKEHTVIMNTGWEPAPGWKVEERPWYKETVRNGGGISVSSPYVDEQTGMYCVTLATMVYGDDGAFLGVFAVDFWMDSLIDILGESYGSYVYAFLVDSDGNILNHPNKAYEMQEDGAVNVADTEYGEIHEIGVPVTLTDYTGKRVIVNRAQLKGTGFFLYIVTDWWAVYSESVIWIAASIILFLACIIIINVMINRIVRWQNAVNRKLKASAEYATNAGKAKSQFLAQMSHEIRTPINAVIGMDEMILREAKDPEILEYASNIQSAGRTLLELINSILDFSKIEEGKMEILPVRYETVQMVDYLVNMIEERATGKGLAFHAEVDEKLPKTLFGDDVRIRQVIVNLLTNAVKYTHEGSVTLRIRGAAVDEENYRLTVSVEDTGIGIKEADMQRLFESFRRLDEVQNRNIEGTGLGISIVQGLLTRMGSKLQVESVYGKGSKFYFTVEQKIIDKTPIGAYSQETHIDAGVRKEAFHVKNAEILVVDDNEMNLKVAKGLLKLYRVTPDMASGGREALKMAREKRYDIIFLDHMMPGMDGIQTLQKMKEEDLVYDTPVVCLTANAIAGVREEYLKQGFADYLSKPIEVKELEAMLEKYLPKEKLVPAGEDWIEADEPVSTAGSRGGAKDTADTGSGSGGNAAEAGSDGSVNASGDGPAAEAGSTGTGSESEAGSDDSGSKDPVGYLTRNGFDTAAGIEYSAGMEEFYLEMVQTFAEGYETKAEEIRTDYEAKNWADYRTRVHALKSTAKMIGANALSELALGQEMAAKEGRIEEIETGCAPLMKAYTEIVEIIRKM